MCQTPKFWDIFCELADCRDLDEDERFSSIPNRRKNLDALTIEIDRVMQQKTTEEWMALLGGKVPFAPVYDLKEALESPYVREVKMRDTVAHPDADGQSLNMLASPIKVNGERSAATRAPKLGEHTKELLDRDP